MPPGGNKRRVEYDGEVGVTAPKMPTSTPAASDDFGTFGSVESVKSELSIFDDNSMQVTHLKGKYLEIRPEQNTYQGTEGTDIDLKTPPSTAWYLNFSDSYIIVKLKLSAADGKTNVAEEVVALENFALGTLFKDVKFR